MFFFLSLSLAVLKEPNSFMKVMKPALVTREEYYRQCSVLVLVKLGVIRT